jgi:hypothetical protein
MPTRMPLIDPRMVGSLADFFPELCTIKTFTEAKSASGAITYTPVDFAGHVALHCRHSPVNGTEVKRQDQSFSVGSHIIELAGYYSTITTKMTAVVNLITYDILAIEFDGEHKTTRLSVEITA